MYGPGPVPFNDGYAVASMDVSTKYQVILLTSKDERLSKGFAHRFRPTYAGANMGHPYRVVETLAGLREVPQYPLESPLPRTKVRGWHQATFELCVNLR